jgi:hypothetical protein
VKIEGPRTNLVRDGFRTNLMVFRIVIRVVAGIVTGVVAGVVTRGDEVYQHHSSTRVVAGGVHVHLNARGPLLPSH